MTSFVWHSAIVRYKGIIGSLCYSASNFSIAFILQKEADAQVFGIFAIIQVIVQFGMSLSNAVFNAPINIQIGNNGRLDEPTFSGFFTANLIVSLALSLALCLGYYLVEDDLVASVCSSCLALFSWLRWFYRSVDLAEGKPEKAFRSDIIYSILVLTGASIIFLMKEPNVNLALIVLTLGSVFSGASLINRRIASSYLHIKSGLAVFITSFRKHGAWALLGVITTEVTSNCYPYLITTISGPDAFAPIAAVNLFYRPITIIIQSLTQYERPRMRSLVSKFEMNILKEEVWRFRIISILSTCGNALAIFFVLNFIPSVIGGGKFNPWQLSLSAAVFSLIYLLRAIRAGDSTALQAMGEFRNLANISLYACPVSLILALVILHFAPSSPAVSLMAIFIGEALMCFAIVRSFHRAISKHYYLSNTSRGEDLR